MNLSVWASSVLTSLMAKEGVQGFLGLETWAEKAIWNPQARR